MRYEIKAPEEAVEDSILAAEEVIKLSHSIENPTINENLSFAAAHYTLALHKHLPLQRTKMHLNASITILQKLPPLYTSNQLPLAYFRRAELLEGCNKFQAALNDYVRAIAILEKFNLKQDCENRLLAQCCVSITDLIVNEEIILENIPLELPLREPLHYIHTALDSLKKIKVLDNETWTTLAYTHQTLGIILSSQDLKQAESVFKSALKIINKIGSLNIYPVIGDLYNCLSLLYQQHYYECPIKYAPEYLSVDSLTYYGLSLLFFSPEEDDEEVFTFESLLEIIERALNPYLPSMNLSTLCDLIDAMIYAYYGILEKILPNEVICSQLEDPHSLSTYAKHVELLVEEFNRKTLNQTARLLSLSDPKTIDLNLDLSHILKNPPNNIYYLNSKHAYHLYEPH
ncbi:MAG: hypothetical protein JWM09_826 [Francisellaceae bacterium]|nr:hypothetical protein [Francisellaceae bacterium]